MSKSISQKILTYAVLPSHGRAHREVYGRTLSVAEPGLTEKNLNVIRSPSKLQTEPLGLTYTQKSKEMSMWRNRQRLKLPCNIFNIALNGDCSFRNSLQFTSNVSRNIKHAV